MPKIIIQSTPSDGTPGTVTLAERTVPTDLHNDHFTRQLIERISWALNDAEHLEADYRKAATKQPVGDDNRGRVTRSGSLLPETEVALASSA